MNCCYIRGSEGLCKQSLMYNRGGNVQLTKLSIDKIDGQNRKGEDKMNKLLDRLSVDYAEAARACREAKKEDWEDANYFLGQMVAYRQMTQNLRRWERGEKLEKPEDQEELKEVELAKLR